MFACLFGPQPADIAREFSPRYELLRDDLVVIDVSGLERLLGPPRTIAEELRREASDRGVRAHVAIARTQTAAVILAQVRPGLTVVEPGGEAQALASVPIGRLAKFNAQGSSLNAQGSTLNAESSALSVETFLRWGLRTLGELAALPAADLVARMGRQALAWQAIARGDDLRPLIPALPEERFDATLELEWPIEGLEPLSFVLTRLLEPLSTRLEKRDRGAAVLHIMLGLVGHRGGDFVRRLELPAPIREVRALRALALLDLESHPPGGPIERVTIVIDPTPGRVLQHTLFTRAHPTPEQIATLIARLGALVGQDRIGAPTTVDTYRPGAFSTHPFKTEHRAPSQPPAFAGSPALAGKPATSQPPAFAGSLASAGKPAPSPQSPLVSALRRCRPPVPARVAVDGGRPVRVTTERRSFAGGAVVHCAGPWRTSGNWWQSQKAQGSTLKAQESSSSRLRPEISDLPWDRDEWDVALNDGAVYRIFQDRVTNGWFIDAIVD
jgi:protein ImuB